MSYWAVVQVEPRLLIHTMARPESLAEYLFARIGLESYLPRVKARNGDGKVRITPLFPGYVFVHVVDQWHQIARTMGVVRVLMSGDLPARLPQRVLDDIRSREYRGFIKLPHRPRFCRGQVVRIVHGQFDGHLALYDGQSARERENVLLELLGRQVRIELAKGDLIEALVSEKLRCY